MAKKVKRKLKIEPKKVIYLIGAGASHAEASHKRRNANLLMADSGNVPGIASAVLEKARIFKDKKYGLERNIDIEKLISLLASTGVYKYECAADELRKLYFKEITRRIKDYGLLNNPELAMSLLEMHADATFSEKSEILAGIINLNHDNLFQEASQKVHKYLNLGFKYQSSRYLPGESSPQILHLHGAFNWENHIPIRVEELNTKNADNKSCLWIPPSILKEAKNYPYTKLIGIAYELLLKKCDILRIVGCSLSQNDWNIVSLIFNTQYIQSHYFRECYRIELIMSPKSGDKIKEQCSYLQGIFTIDALKDGNFSQYSGKRKDYPEDSILANPFKYWLIQKAKYHIKKKSLNGEVGIPTLSKLIEG